MAEEQMLQLGPDFTVPPDVVTQSLAIMGVKGSGKSNAAAVLAEEMFDAGLPWVAIDPKGDWWGLRSSADGTGPGLPIPIFGGLHGDMPLVPEAGALMADLIFEHNLTCVLDVSRFSIAARARFLTEFGDRLFDLHQANPTVRMVFLEEAHRILPQMVRQDMARCVGTWVKIIAEGRSFGVGIAILDQRCATVNKDGISEIEWFLGMRTTSPQDRKAVRDWMIHHALAAELVESLPSMPSGETWSSSSDWLPQNGQEALQRRKFRRRRTYDSGATPKVGQVRKATALADIDLAALSERMAAVVEQAGQNDPAKLKRKVADLQRQLAKRNAPDPAELAQLRAENAALLIEVAGLRAREPERVEVPVLAPGDLAAVEQAIAALQSAAGNLELALSRASRPAPAPAQPVPTPRAEPLAPRPADPTPVAPSGSRNISGITEAGSATSLPKAQRAILTVLAQFPAGRTKMQLALLSNYSAKSSGFDNALGALRSAGLVNRGTPIKITDDGFAAAGDVEPMPTGDALLERWMQTLGKAERAIVTCLLGVWPGAMSKAELAEATNYSARSSGFDNALGRLRTLELVNRGQEIAINDTFAQEVKESADA